MATGLLCTLLALVLVAGVYTALDNGRVVIRKQRVLAVDLPKALEGYTVLHISDLHGARFGPAQKQIAAALSTKSYNAVVITGDMLGADGDPAPFYELLAALGGKPVYFIAGDSDPAAVPGGGSVTALADWIEGAKSRGAIYVDAHAQLAVGSARVWFSDASQLTLDVEEAAARYAQSNTRESNYWSDVMARTEAAREAMQPADLHIALTHRPISQEAALTMQGYAADTGSTLLRSVNLVAAGHHAGGLWRLPGIGAVWADGWFPEDGGVIGYGQTGALLQYISGGLGAAGHTPLPSLRLFNTPEMTLITFTSQLADDVLPR
ncbi:MAG: metallophosphoesterase [Oscillospiraceae bacterium]|nr:metallophosphoesterase [Oscillospiraceae bacterium]